MAKHWLLLPVCSPLKPKNGLNGPPKALLPKALLPVQSHSTLDLPTDKSATPNEQMVWKGFGSSKKLPLSSVPMTLPE